MIVTFNGKVTTESAEEKEVFKVMKEFMNSNFQDYEFSISGKNETLNHKWHKPESVNPLEGRETKQNKI